MPDVTIKARENGPLLVTGPVTITDHLGNVFDISGRANVALCRCGQTKNRPFCDGSHKSCGFIAGEIAQPPAATVANPIQLSPLPINPGP